MGLYSLQNFYGKCIFWKQLNMVFKMLCTKIKATFDSINLVFWSTFHTGDNSTQLSIWVPHPWIQPVKIIFRQKLCLYSTYTSFSCNYALNNIAQQLFPECLQCTRHSGYLRGCYKCTGACGQVKTCNQQATHHHIDHMLILLSWGIQNQFSADTKGMVQRNWLCPNFQASIW